MELFFNAYNFAKNSIWQDDTPDNLIFATAKEVFKKLKKGCTRGKRFFRLAGQSGSGKTSQLLAATNHLCELSEIKPMHIAVRNFASFFPDASICATSPNFREISNGFALKVLICVLKQAFEEHFDIILEIALLDKAFEKFVFGEIEKHSYFQLFQILSVNKAVSDAFIEKRQALCGRLTSSRSSEYFYDVMKSSFKYISKKYDCECIVWSAFDSQPVFCGRLRESLSPFKSALKIKAKFSVSEKALLKAKKTFLEERYLDELS